MATRRKIKEFWIEVKRTIVLAGEPFVKQTTCCCDAPGDTRKACAAVNGKKNPCRCFCHETRY